MELTKNIWFKILTLILTILARVRYGQICNAFGLPDLATSDICIYMYIYICIYIYFFSFFGAKPRKVVLCNEILESIIYNKNEYFFIPLHLDFTKKIGLTSCTCFVRCFQLLKPTIYSKAKKAEYNIVFKQPKYHIFGRKSLIFGLIHV